MVQHSMHHQVAQPNKGSLESHQHEHAVNNNNNNNDQLEPDKAFFQLTGHKECFRPGTKPGTILKLSTGNEEKCLRELMNTNLSQFVPKLVTTIIDDDKGQKYLELENLLARFADPSVMDVKLGCRTYQEEELDLTSKGTKLRPDMYAKMVEIDSSEPTVEERKVKAITKPRYMIWRETVSSTASLGFRIEGMRLADGTVDKEFKLIKKEEQIVKSLTRYVMSHKIRVKYLNRLYDLKCALLQSNFFWRHELIGSSLLFVHNDDDANIWMIDFAKTRPLPDNLTITHRKKWEIGNREDGYLNGIENLIRMFELLVSQDHTISNRSTTLLPTKQQEKNQRNPDATILPHLTGTGPTKTNSLNTTPKRLLLS